jgi:hypothetical protein
MSALALAPCWAFCSTLNTDRELIPESKLRMQRAFLVEEKMSWRTPTTWVSKRPALSPEKPPLNPHMSPFSGAEFLPRPRRRDRS